MHLVKMCLPKAALAFVVFAVMTGIVYTGVLTGVARIIFPFQANGSVLVGKDGKKYSMLLGQTYTQDKYLWGRIQDFDFAVPSGSETHLKEGNSSIIPHSHGPAGKQRLMYSWASNRSPAGDAENEHNKGPDGDFETLMRQNVATHVVRIKAANPEMGATPIPVALVTNSGSGLDPHIPPAAAEYQIKRIARARGISEDEVRRIIAQCTAGKFLGLMGEETVHVLKVNLMLDGAL